MKLGFEFQLTNCVILSKLLNLDELSFFMCGISKNKTYILEIAY